MSAPEPATNPLRAGLRASRRAPPCVLVIFGVSGDLAARKLLPALHALAVDDLLDEETHVVGVSRREWDDAELRRRMRDAVREFTGEAFDENAWRRLESRMHHVRVASDSPDDYARLAATVRGVEASLGPDVERVFYLAVPPSAFAPSAHALAAAGLLEGAAEGRARLVVEKPFGTDLESARALNRELQAVAPERALFRIDHYLGKETVQNLLVFRFANGMFEPLWNARYVDHVQITVAESLGVGSRGDYYEEAGALRDMVQNHLFHVLALVAMEPPVAFEADAVRDEKVKVLRALRPVDRARIDAICVRGQYTRGAPLGKEIPGYLEAPGVADGSTTETFVALEVHVDNWRWSGVPFYVRTGKALPRKASEIAIHFKDVPHRLFAGDLEANVLALRIQPDEGMSLRFQTKVPGPEMATLPVTMEFRYGTSFGESPPEAYERLLLDALLGDGTLFTRSDEVEASWRWCGALRAAWEAASPPEPYAAGTWGPEGADALLARSGRRWRRP